MTLTEPVTLFSLQIAALQAGSNRNFHQNISRPLCQESAIIPVERNPQEQPQLLHPQLLAENPCRALQRSAASVEGPWSYMGCSEPIICHRQEKRFEDLEKRFNQR